MTDPVLKPEDVDKLGQALLSLTRELWVLKDRQRILESVLEEAGILAADAIDAYEPDDRLTATLTAERRQLIDSVLGALATSSFDTPQR